jgi:hypothetical protein
VTWIDPAPAIARRVAHLLGQTASAAQMRAGPNLFVSTGTVDLTAGLRHALQDAGHAVALTVEVGRVVDSPARRNASASAERQEAAESIIHNNPLVQSWIRDFGAKIVPGSIRPL